MKTTSRVLAIILGLAVFASLAFSQSDQRTVLATSTANGVTKTIYVGRIQADPGKDGTITITVFPVVVISDSAGNVISETPVGQTPSFPLVIPSQVKTTLAQLVQAAYAAAQPSSP